ncbi:MAG: ABC transporter permease [Eubacterium sp.]|nr:ABC transporter permease [Eubacterium sp.]MDD6568976.1 ABC transporter permease [Eubacteriales bacterium]MDY4111113.1 ABC transporter permease [Eubacterium sp.]
MGAFISAIPGAIGLGLIWGIMAIGVYITFRVLDFADLTVDGTLATGGAVLVVAMMNGVNVYLALLLAFVAGCIAGFVTGVLNTLLGIPAILAGILTQLALYSVNLRILGKSNQALSVYKYHVIASMTNITKAIIIVAIFVVAIIAILYWFFDTELGHSIRATGCNQNMSRANGINIKFTKIVALVLSNGLVALSGGLLAQYQGFADVNMGRGAIVIGLAAVIIGEVIFGKIFKNFALRLLAVAFGGIIYYVVMQFVISLGLNTDDLKLLTAAIVAIFLGIPYLKSQYAQKHIKMKEGNK